MKESVAAAWISQLAEALIEIAQGVENVKQVVNQLTVGPIASFGVRSNDTWLTSKAKTALINTKYVPSGTIAVTTDHSVVYLMGKVTQAEGDYAANAVADPGLVKPGMVFIMDFGGGLGIDYHGDTPPQADALWQQLLQRLDERGFGNRKIVIEPGRSLVGNAGVCLTEVLYQKPGEHKNFLIVDAAMNDLPRPAMYQAFHRIVEVTPRSDAPTTWDVVGPVCESGDWLGRDRALAAQSGDVLAVLSAGAYCMSMASNYNTRGRAAEVLVDGNTATLIRARESAADQLRLETLLPPV